MKFTPCKDKADQEKADLSLPRKQTKTSAPANKLQPVSTDVKGKQKPNPKHSLDEASDLSSSDESDHLLAAPIIPMQPAPGTP
jgi:hypothetical protein